MNKVCCKCGNEFDISEMWYSRHKYTCRGCRSIEYTNKIKKKKKGLDPKYELRNNKRQMVRDYMRLDSVDITDPIYQIVGCSPEELRLHLESKFTEGMSWNNYSYYGWNIDHMKPISLGHTDEELNELCHYTNLQPLWHEENTKKGCKFTI